MRRNICFLLCAALLTLAARSTIAQTTLYVSQTSTDPTPPYTTWDTAAHTIQEAVDAANDGDTVLVAAGEYRLTNQVSITKAILLRSDTGAEQTAIHGQDDFGGPKRCLWISNPGATVDGFTLRNGNGTPEGGGGAFIVGATVQNCIIQSCYSNPSGAAGGVVMVGGMLSNCIVKFTPVGIAASCTSGGLVTDCQIVDNRFASAKGGIYLSESELRNSVISGNRAFDDSPLDRNAAVYAVFSTISGCTISNNSATSVGGGAYLDGCEMDRCIIANNRAFAFQSSCHGGGIFATNSVIRNSLIVSNLTSGGSSFGGGVYLSGGSLLNCTVSGNASGTGAGVYVENGAVRNSVVYFNWKFDSTSESNWDTGGGGSFEYVCTTPHPGGIGNIVEDPQFVNRLASDYHLAQTSPCIDAGINEAWMAGAFDLDGNPRIVNGTVDLGAWEAPLTDVDGDGVPDRRDFCPNTPAGSVVNAEGCSIAQLCPCEGPWRNHDEYVRCVTQSAGEFYRAGLITLGQRQEIVRTAAQSDCGKSQERAVRNQQW